MHARPCVDLLVLSPMKIMLGFVSPLLHGFVRSYFKVNLERLTPKPNTQLLVQFIIIDCNRRIKPRHCNSENWQTKRLCNPACLRGVVHET